MYRRVIIIGYDGGKANYLEGVKYDVANYTAFLKSNQGGVWGDDEITVFNGSNKRVIRLFISEEVRKGCQYFLIVFTGHGYCDRSGETFFEVCAQDAISLSEIRAWVKETPCLMIADSCHAVPAGLEPLTESRIRLFSSGGRFYFRAQFREEYNRALSVLPKGSFVFASACSFGETADDTENGGLYSRAIITAAEQEISASTASEIVSIGWIHHIAKEIVIRESDGRQHPEISGIVRGYPQPPFVVILR